jgi:lipopolysaccharide export LptBFGC system permease protein LptF
MIGMPKEALSIVLRHSRRKSKMIYLITAILVVAIFVLGIIVGVTSGDKEV